MEATDTDITMLRRLELPNLVMSRNQISKIDQLDQKRRIFIVQIKNERIDIVNAYLNNHEIMENILDRLQYHLRFFY